MSYLFGIGLGVLALLTWRLGFGLIGWIDRFNRKQNYTFMAACAGVELFLSIYSAMAGLEFLAAFTGGSFAFVALLCVFKATEKTKSEGEGK